MIAGRVVTSSKKLRGFSLVEMAIVLGVIAAILGGLWQIINIVWENTRREQTLEAMTVAVTNVRQLYSGQLSMNPAEKKKDLIPKLVSQNAIPSYLVRKDTSACLNTGAVCADTPFGYSNPSDTEGPQNGTFQVCDWAQSETVCDFNTAGNSISFAIRLLQLDQGTCAQLINKLTGSSGPAGLIGLNLNGGTIALPVSSVDAATDCQSNAKLAAGNKLSFIYRLDAAAQ